MTLRHRFILLLASVVVAFLALFGIHNWEAGSHQNSWDNLQSQALARQQLLLEMRQHAGYGALIHNFKNYVLRGDGKYHQRMQRDFSEVAGLLQQYRALPQLTSEEQQALNDIEATLKAYRNASDQVQALITQGMSIAELDRAVKISDSAAIEGFMRLEAHYLEMVEQATAEFEAISQAGSRYMLLAIALALVLIIGAVYWLCAYQSSRLAALLRRANLRKARFGGIGNNLISC